MRRLAVLLVAVAALAGLANLAVAGDYHVGRLLICSDCHIAHGSQTHGYATDADTTWVGPHAADPPYPYLLRGETVNNACLNCHDGKMNIPDVLMAGTNPPLHGRSAGALNLPSASSGHGYSPDGVYTEGMGHTLWSPKSPPGAKAGSPPIGTEGLECSDCHRVHGSKYFRNMMGDVLGSSSTFIDPAWFGVEVTYDISPTPVTGSTAWVLEKSALNYDNDNVQYLEPVTSQSMYGEWCGVCHGNFHGNATDADILQGTHIVRHPTAGVDIAVPATGNQSWLNTDATHRLKVMSATGQWAASTNQAGLTPSCFTCHKSHGNANRFGLVFVLPRGDDAASAAPPSSPTVAIPAGSTIPAVLAALTRSATMTEQGDGGQYRDMCRNCHGMGRWPTGNPTNIGP
jgi:hypothetical protein